MKKSNNELVGETVIIAVMAAAAVVGRIAFASVPDFKPTTAIVILAGISLGKTAGFYVGALAALVSNFYFGQGLWTPWQMLAWGLTGFIAGLFCRVDFSGKKLWLTVVLGVLSAYMYGFIMNIFFVAFYVRPLTAAGIAAAFAASIAMDSIHAVSTASFLCVLAIPWLKKLKRVKEKYGIFNKAHSR